MVSGFTIQHDVHEVLREAGYRMSASRITMILRPYRYTVDQVDLALLRLRRMGLVRSRKTTDGMLWVVAGPRERAAK